MIPANYYPSFVPQAYRTPMVGTIILLVAAWLVYKTGIKQGWWNPITIKST